MCRRDRLTRNICMKVTEDEFEGFVNACKKHNMKMTQYLMYLINKEDGVEFRSRTGEK